MAGYQHALFLILLLSALLGSLHDTHKPSLYLLAGGILLVLLPPFVIINIPWDLILALVLPWVIWQNSESWFDISWIFPKRESFLWLLAVIALTAIMYILGSLTLVQAAFFAIIAASIFWFLSHQTGPYRLVEVIGPLTIVVLLVETSLPLNTPNIYIGTLFSGAAVGIILATLAITVTKKIPAKYSRWILLGLAYLTYWIAYALNTSPIAAVMISVVVFREFYLNRLDRNQIQLTFTQFDNRLPFYILLSLFIFIAWQSHQPMMLIQWWEVILGLLSGLLVAILGQRIGVPRFEHFILNWRNALKLGLFLFGFLLLWPRGAELKPILIWVALGIAVLLPGLSTILLDALRDITTQRPNDFPDEF